MSGLDIFKEMGQSLSGAISKAVIEIYDERKLAQDITVEAVKRTAALTAAGVSLTELEKAINNVNTNLKKNLEKLTSAVPSNNATKKRFEVKFNPSQISFQVYGGNKVAKTDLTKSQSASDAQLKTEYVEMAPRIQMNVQLIFDDFERTQAFMMEKMNDPQALIRTGVVGAVSAKQKKTYSVRPQVEGFIGALRNNYTRKISFSWGEMTYTGVLTNVNAQYTMFSTDGNPIRANVDLGILCTDSTMHDDYMGQWQKSYKEMFGNDATTDLGSKLQHAGNLLNINL